MGAALLNVYHHYELGELRRRSDVILCRGGLRCCLSRLLVLLLRVSDDAREPAELFLPLGIVEEGCETREILPQLRFSLLVECQPTFDRVDCLLPRRFLHFVLAGIRVRLLGANRANVLLHLVDDFLRVRSQILDLLLESRVELLQFLPECRFGIGLRNVEYVFLCHSKDELFQGLFVRFGQRLSRGIALFEETPLRKLFSNHVPIGCAGCLLELLGDVGADRVERTDRGRMRNGRSARSVRARQGAASGSLRGGNSSPRRVHQQLHGDRRARSLEHPAQVALPHEEDREVRAHW
ncbi:hypothetical protein PMAYCL1PPCAC_28250 [Pristionchus mayeri]|uniref:Uncharacterized protein n=1 Tax=Pristionchus mayeri TaxID=1317129 RepID=A0AAN5D8M6_9BILA|nr:hypothetical protein PMAYCL1PPCAC_28250 [Pristionchus mayeri]